MELLEGLFASAAVVSIAASPASAPTQQAAPTAQGEPSKPPQPAGQTITVTGERSAAQTSIDRNSYAIGNDLQGATGTMADVLRNIPSVQVDPQGNVSIRGNRNVVILEDGQPVLMLRGPNGGAALQQLPSSQYERVEVMTNPSAAYGPDGSGGIINLIRKKNRKAGLTGSARANAGAHRRVNGGVSGAYSTDRTTLSGDISGRRDQLTGLTERRRETRDVASGAFDSALQDTKTVTKTLSAVLRGGVEQALGGSSRLSLGINRSDLRSDSDLTEELDAAAGAFTRQADTRFELDSREIEGRFTSGSGDSKFSADASHQRSNSGRRIISDTQFVTAEEQISEEFRYDLDQTLSEAKAEYSTGEEGNRLRLGSEIEVQDNSHEDFGARGPDRQTLVPIEDFNSQFTHKQEVYGLYGTYERTFGKLTALGGLRFERVELDLFQATDGTRVRRGYSKLYPTLHLAYDLTDTQQVKASYSRRIQRPGGRDLNPFVEFRDPANLRAGNPHLKPEETDSFELSWQSRSGSNLTQASLYYQAVRNDFTNVVELLPNGVLLTTRENLGKGKTLGLEAVINRKLGSKLTLNASANVGWNEVEPGLPGFAESRSGLTVSGRGSLSWQPTERDFLQISGFLSGRSFMPQGHREPSGMINAGYRRRITSQLAAVATVRDLLGNFGETIVYDTSQLRDRAERKFGGRVVFVGLAYTLGSSQRGRRDSGFSFEAGRSE